MVIYKNKDIYTNINERGANLGNVDVTLYSRDKLTAALRIFINKEVKYQDENILEPVNLSQTNMIPMIDLYAEDGSIFKGEKLRIISAEAGLVEYDFPRNIVDHIGKMNASIYLESEDESVEVARFYFYIDDDGLTKRIGREFSPQLFEDLLEGYLKNNSNIFNEIESRLDAWQKLELKENLFDKYLINTTISNSSGKEFSNSSTATSEYIKVDDSKKYTVGVKKILDDKYALVKLAYYDVDQSYISSGDWINLASENNKVISLPKATRYVRVIVNTTHKDVVFFNEGEEPYYNNSDSVSIFNALIPDNSITEDKLIEALRNKLKTATKITNLFTVYNTKTTLSNANGTENANDTTVTSRNYIAIDDNRFYTIGLEKIVDSKKSLTKVAFYNEKKDFISITDWINLANENDKILTPPIGARYVKIVVNNESCDVLYFNEGKIPYFEIGKTEDTNNTSNNENQQPTEIKNLFTNYFDNTTVSANSGNSTSNTSNVASDFIDVSMATTYVLGIEKVIDKIKGASRVFFYDKNTQLISASDWYNLVTNKQIITTPSGTYYVRIVINKEHKDVVYFNEGKIPYFDIKKDEDKTENDEDKIDDKVVTYKSQKPYPQKFYWQTLQESTNIKPLDLSRDGKLILASNGASVAQSTDEGNTWIDVGSAINGTLIQSIRILDDGELLVGTSKYKTDNIKSKLFKSKGYSVSDPSKTTFYEVLEMNSGDANFNNPWCLDKYYNIILASEYGGHYLTGARYVYLSTDYGETWKTIFDQSQMASTVDGAPSYTTDAHVHTCHYDRYRDRIWVCVGDQDNTATYYSDDMGKTWKLIKGYTGKETMQYTGITSYPEGVFFGSDRAPDGVYFWDANQPNDIKPFYLTERDSIRTVVYALPFRRFAEKNEVTYFVANRDDIVDGKMGPLIVGLKGVLGAQLLYDFTDDFNQFTYTDISGCLGNTAQGNVIVSVKDKNTNRYRLLRAKAPVWE
ncbi:BppU family phage baseplate upper protein [Staphylococcus haemolyticus]|uniref:BppU family phage baseplate upper protein n=1 Tax=Staphylococcus haemolyticus TaxID=1283 RepID=UPI00190B1A7D|nr:BppU family phage baseplate upper protein [Staphylococcus haemolyticus]MBK3950158.1 BppU family phage baseplate upper protein [Staphylococcus haemolyticus]